MLESFSTQKDGWRVIHAVPNETENELDTVKYESISSFIQPDKCIKSKGYTCFFKRQSRQRGYTICLTKGWYALR